MLASGTRSAAGSPGSCAWPVRATPPRRIRCPAPGWLVLEHFLGTVWHADTGEVLDSVQALIEQGNVDPVTVREVSWTLRDVTAFYCPECRLNFCRPDWSMHFAVNPGSHDYIIGICPSGHRHLLG